MMKNFAILLWISICLLSCKFGREESESVNFSVNVGDEATDFEEISFKVFSINNGQRIGVDSMGAGGKMPPFKEQEKYPHYLFDIGLRYTNYIETIDHGIYELNLTLRDGKMVKKEFGEFVSGKTKKQFSIFINGDSSITIE